MVPSAEGVLERYVAISLGQSGQPILPGWWGPSSGVWLLCDLKRGVGFIARYTTSSTIFLASRLFRQPMVPVVGAADGRWLLPGRLAPAMKPGGHGAIWKLMLDQGVFQWLLRQGREAAVVRQIR